MTSLLDTIGKVAKITALHNDDDVFDRLSHRYTLVVLFICTLIVSTKQYVGDPIACWCIDPCSSNHERYMNNICWISNTYYVPPEDEIPIEIPERQDRELSYYQWVPFILMSMACVFYLPHIVWRVFTERVGLDISGIVSSMHRVDQLKSDMREQAIRHVVRHMDRYLVSQCETRTGCFARIRAFLGRSCLLCSKRYGNQIVAVYLAVKLLYIGNVIVQLFLLNLFLRTDYSAYGIEVMSKLLSGTDWGESRRFPRVTMCDFGIRRLGGRENVHLYTVQCTLPINLFSEKIFIFIWFWLVVVAALSVYGLVPWVGTLFRRSRLRYLKKHLRLADRFDNGDGILFKAFADKYLQQDGVLVLRIISENTNSILIGEVIAALWDYFKQYRRSSVQSSRRAAPSAPTADGTGRGFDSNVLRVNKNGQV